jgi:tRNA-modifying protein YgfZ
MTDVTADYLALRRDVAAVRLPRTVIRAFGADSIEFLQGQLSQDLSGLAAGESRWSLLLDPQGKVVAWVRVWGRQVDDEVLMDVESAAAGAVIERLNRFRFRVATEFELLDWDCVAVRGPACPAPEDIDVRSELRAEVGWPGRRGVDLLGPQVAVPEGMHLAGPDAYETIRIEAGWPANGNEFDAEPEPSVIPGEAGQWLIDRSVSFTKGCYTGQELVARVDSRGNRTPRRLRGVVLGTNVVPPVGAEVVVVGADGAEQPRGVVTSVGESLDLRAPVALAWVHRSVEPPATVELRWTGPSGESAVASAEVRDLPLLEE